METITKRHHLIGEGRHTWVLRRPGSRYVLQIFKPNEHAAHDFTVPKIHAEENYLRRHYRTALPRLIPWQRLYLPHPGANLTAGVLVKRYVPHDEQHALTRLHPHHLSNWTLRQLEVFLTITRNLLLTSTPGKWATLPDIIDPPFHNLVVDGNHDLRLVDTNRLISVRKLARAAAEGHPAPPGHKVHTMLIRRLLFLETRYHGKTRDQLISEYAPYVDAATFDRLATEAAHDGEPFTT